MKRYFNSPVIRRIELCYFSVSHGEKVEYFHLDWSTLWLLFKRALQGWKIKITAVKAVDRDEIFFTIIGEK
jgi:hypothetical protein